MTSLISYVKKYNQMYVQVYLNSNKMRRYNLIKYKGKIGYKSIKSSTVSTFDKLRLDTHLAGVNEGNTYGTLR